MPLKQRFDSLLLTAVVLLLGVGLTILASASWLLATERYGRAGSYFVTWQVATAIIGLGMLVAAMHVRLELLIERRVLTAAVIASWVALAIAMLQPRVANTHRWLDLGVVSVQPSVVARLVMVLFTAWQLDLARREGWPARRLAIVGGAVVITAVLIGAAPDLGSAALLILILAAMAVAAGMPVRLLVIPGVAGLASLAAAIVVSPYRRERVVAFLNPEAAVEASWQGYQSLVAIGSGGVLGRGYGSGLQKLFFLPEPHTDFIFSITGEEFGLFGLLVLMVLAATITWRGMRVALRQTNQHLALVAFGLVFAYAAQSLVHMAVCLDLLPPKGIPLPLVSYGKTDLVVSLASLGLVLNLSREVGS